MNAKASARESNLAIFKKEITIGEASNTANYFETPSVALRSSQSTSLASLSVNEVVKHIDYPQVQKLETQMMGKFKSQIKRNEFKPGKLNLLIFNLKFNTFPDENILQTVAQTLYSASDKTVVLPFIKTKLLQEEIPTKNRDPEKPQRMKNIFTTKKQEEYVKMMTRIMDETENAGNNKEFIGTIPLIPPKFSRPIVDFYLKRGIRQFAIDVGNQDLLLNDGDLRIIISTLASKVDLRETLIYGCNLGLPRLPTSKTEVRADDFLGLFAYIDILGNTFKPRAIRKDDATKANAKELGEPTKRKAKKFSRDRYSYLMEEYSNIRNEKGEILNYESLKTYNRCQQLKEADDVRQLIGHKKLKAYLEKKTALDKPMINRLESLATIQQSLFP